MAAPAENHWRAHPFLGFLVRAAVVLVPLAVSVAASLALIAVLPAPSSLLESAAWWALVLGVAWMVTWAVDRVGRRALPLAVLLELSLVFPDRAPSRLRAARGATVREIGSRLTKLRGADGPAQADEVAEMLVTLVGVLGLHDPKTRGHSERVRAYVDLISAELHLPEEDRTRLRWAALVHDLGKLTVPREVLNGGSDLSAEDWAQLRRHPEEGRRLAAGLLPWLGPWGHTVEQHHEQWSGGGYPRGLAGDQISQGARIVAVADAFEVMTTNRTYARARSAGAARAELSRCAGTQFDPAVVRAFLQISLGRLRWTLGPLSWLSVLPFAARRAGDILRAGAMTGAVVGAVAVVPAPGAGSSSPPSTGTEAGSARIPASSTPTTLTGEAGLASAAPGAPVSSASASFSAAPASSAPRPRPGSTPSTGASAARPTRSPAAPAPATSVRSYFLSTAGLTRTRPTGQQPSTVRLVAGGASRSFDFATGATASRLSGRPTLVLYDEVVAENGKSRGLGQLSISISDCASRSGPCTTIATSRTTVGDGDNRAGYRKETKTLPAVSRVLPPRHVLRITFALESQGTARRVDVAFGAVPTQSRLELTGSPPP
ncbi:MAG TPA: HD domain-containing phosphohydrolase [Mycobacteriales bacterium]|nr:HD domain-containing phosphohydrolase [Mycobacteriales bacterium]